MGPGRITCIVIALLFAAGCDTQGLIAGDAHADPEIEAEPPPVDTDGDGIPDDVEGRWDPGGPVDTDGDGIPDYQDLDSDDDGIPDEFEAPGMPHSPPDSDGDGVPDFRDTDSDGDAILDSIERILDSDHDGIPDYLDRDSDCDTIPDADEAGDSLLETPPVDTDGDGWEDYRDPDSDDDGLPDWWESLHGLDPCDADPDGDGIPDLIEVGAGTDPLDASLSPRTEERYAFLVPYNEPGTPGGDVQDPEPTMDHIVMATDFVVDVFFAIDTTGSMREEYPAIRSNLVDVTVPALEASLPDAWFGVGRFEDCGACAHNMAMLQGMTDDLDTVEASLTGWTMCGGNTPFTQYLWALAWGDVAPFLGWTNVTPEIWTCTPPGDIGWPCFRPGALPVVVQFGDDDFARALSMCSPSYDHTQAITALNHIHAKYVGVNSGDGRYDMVIIAEGTGSVDEAGLPFVFDISSTADDIGTQIVDAVALAVPDDLEVTFFLRDDFPDRVDTMTEFLDYVEPGVVGGVPDPADPSIICASGLEVDDLHDPLDGRPDTFTAVPVGTAVCFDLYVKQNWTVPREAEPGSYPLEICSIGDDGLILDTRQIFFIVPPYGTDPWDITCDH